MSEIESVMHQEIVAVPRSRALTLRRPQRWAVLMGVCAGLSLRYRIPVALVRIAFVLLAIKGGIGLVLYGALALAMPFEAESPSAP